MPVHLMSRSLEVALFEASIAKHVCRSDMEDRPFGLTIIPGSKCTYINFKSSQNILQKKGGYKKVTLSLRLPHNPLFKAELIAHRVCESTEQSTRELTNELILDKKPQLLRDTYIDSFGQEAKLSAFAALVDGTLRELDSSSLNQEAKNNITLQLLQHLKYIHDKGYVHGDIKTDNIFVMKRTDGTYDVRLSDFGVTFNPAKEEAPFPMSKGYYGAVAVTSPELFGRNCNKHKDDISPFAAEIFSIAMVLYDWLGEKTPWYSHVITCYKTKKLPSPEKRNAYINSIQSQINKNREIHKDNKLNTLLLDMLDPDPKKRPSLSEAISILT